MPRARVGMYSKDEEKALKKEFWDGFADYAQPFLKERGKRTWLLFNTRIRGLEFKFYVDRQKAGVLLEINAKNEDRRFRIFEALNDYKSLLEEGMPTLDWHLIAETPMGKEVSEISVCLSDVDYYNRQTWPAIYPFFCTTMLLFEENYFDIFESLKAELQH